MKKLFDKKVLFSFFSGILVCSGIVYGANQYQSNGIEYTPTDNNWKVSNVNDAINSLYSMKTELDNIKGIGDATAANILKGKKAVVKGSAVTGTMNNHSKAQIWINGDNGTFYDNVNYTSSSGNVTNEMVGFKSKYSGYFTPDTTWIFGSKSSLAPLIKSGSKLLGVTGTYTSDATATAADILTGKTAYVNGNKITGTAKGGSQIVNLGTGRSFNIASIVGEENIGNYTNENFIVATGGFSTSLTSDADSDHIGKDATASVSTSTASVNYDPLTGNVTVSGGTWAMSIYQKYSDQPSSSGNLSTTVYFIS